MSITRSGSSTPSFMRSTRVVPPARKRTLAPCWAVAETARGGDGGRAIGGAGQIEGLHGQRPSDPARRTCWIAATMFGIGAAAAEIAAHELAHVVIRRADGSSSSATADMIWPEVQ